MTGFNTFCTSSSSSSGSKARDYFNGYNNWGKSNTSNIGLISGLINGSSSSGSTSSSASGSGSSSSSNYHSGYTMNLNNIGLSAVSTGNSGFMY